VETEDKTDALVQPKRDSKEPQFNGERQLVVVVTNAGVSYVGHIVSDGPGVLRLMLTRPFIKQARIVEIPLEEIHSTDPFAESQRPEPV
jgi:hypothetical protein